MRVPSPGTVTIVLEKPFSSNRDLAWPSVKLFAPSTGAAGWAVPVELMALLPGVFDDAWGSSANAGTAASNVAARARIDVLIEFSSF